MICKQRTENVANQKIVDDFLFGNKSKVGCLDKKDFSYNSIKKQITLKIKGVNYDFKLEKKLGSGSYGTVSKYRDSVHNVFLAIKEAKNNEEDEISNALQNSDCNVLRSRCLGKAGSKYLYIMELAEGDLLNLVHNIQKPTSVQFVFNIVEQIRRQMLCIYELKPKHYYLYADVKLLNILYKCDDPNDLNNYKSIFGRLGECYPSSYK